MSEGPFSLPPLPPAGAFWRSFSSFLIVIVIVTLGRLLILESNVRPSARLLLLSTRRVDCLPAVLGIRILSGCFLLLVILGRLLIMDSTVRPSAHLHLPGTRRVDCLLGGLQLSDLFPGDHFPPAFPNTLGET